MYHFFIMKKDIPTTENGKSNESVEEQIEFIPFKSENDIAKRPCEGECLNDFMGLFLCDKVDFDADCLNEGSCCLNNDEEKQILERKLFSEKSRSRKTTKTVKKKKAKKNNNNSTTTNKDVASLEAAPPFFQIVNGIYIVMIYVLSSPEMFFRFLTILPLLPFLPFLFYYIQHNI